MLLYSLLYLIGRRRDHPGGGEELPPVGRDAPPATPRTSSPRPSRPPPARWARASPTRSASPSPRKSCAPASARKLVDHHTYVIAGDGCLMEGVSQEAIALAGQQKLSRLIVFWDNNGITIDGKVAWRTSTDQPARFEACGWHVQEIDGHDPDAIDAAIAAAKADRPPSMIACKTHIALGHAAQDTAKGHGALTDAEQCAAAKRGLWLDRTAPSTCPPTSSASGRRSAPAAPPRARPGKARLAGARQNRQARVRARTRRARCPTKLTRHDPRAEEAGRREPRPRSPRASPRKWCWRWSTRSCPRPSAAPPT